MKRYCEKTTKTKIIELLGEVTFAVITFKTRHRHTVHLRVCFADLASYLFFFDFLYIFFVVFACLYWIRFKTTIGAPLLLFVVNNGVSQAVQV